MNNGIAPKDAAAFFRTLSTNLIPIEQDPEKSSRGVQKQDVDQALVTTFEQLGIDPSRRDGFEALVNDVLSGQDLWALPREVRRRAEFLEATTSLGLPAATVRNNVSGIGPAIDLNSQLRVIAYDTDTGHLDFKKSPFGDAPTGFLKIMSHHPTDGGLGRATDGVDGVTHVGGFSTDYPQDYRRIYENEPIAYGDGAPMTAVDLARDITTKFFPPEVRFPADYRADPLESSPQAKAAATLVDLHEAIAGKSRPPTAKLVAYGEALQKLFDLPPLTQPEFAQLKRMLAKKDGRSAQGFMEVLAAFVTKSGTGSGSGAPVDNGEGSQLMALNIAMAVQGRFN